MNKNDLVVNSRKVCSVCGYSHLSDIMDLPNLPLTGLFSSKKSGARIKGINQKLLWCPKCGHGQLWRQINPSVLYDFDKYTFRTSASNKAKEGTKFFLKFLKTVIGSRTLSYGIDVGCNDLYLLNESAPFIKKRLGIDPIWSQKSPSHLPAGLRVLGKTIEEVDFKTDIWSRPDIIFCRHTIEHICNPRVTISKLMEFADKDTLFVFETPSFETLVERCRFDQVFHEHLQYFSPASFEHLVREQGGEIICQSENYHDWGAMIIAFRKCRPKKRKFKFGFSKNELEKRISIFREQMKNTASLLREFSGSRIYGYGAAMMLPVLGYHLNTNFSSLKAILDDDLSKDGKYYANLPVKIKHSSKLSSDELRQANVLITAVDNAQAILPKLLSARARNIIYPFHVI